MTKYLSGSKLFWPLVIFLLAFLLRFTYLFEASKSVFFNFPIIDGAMFEGWGTSF
ncbi:MAG: hypothetical protein HQ564_02200 [Candidatus Saganbacteria bacterium]|nr:hypothetical protein [Candidatus Saganbacteria bacterium]